MYDYWSLNNFIQKTGLWKLKKPMQESLNRYLHPTNLLCMLYRCSSFFLFPNFLCTCLLPSLCLPLASCLCLCSSLSLPLVSCRFLCLLLVSYLPLFSCWCFCPSLSLPLFCRCLCLSAFSARSPFPGSSSCLLAHPVIFHLLLFFVHWAVPLTTAPPCDGIYHMQCPLSPL